MGVFFILGERGFEPLSPLGHTVLSRTRLPFRHSPIYVYYRNFKKTCKGIFRSLENKTVLFNVSLILRINSFYFLGLLHIFYQHRFLVRPATLPIDFKIKSPRQTYPPAQPGVVVFEYVGFKIAS